MASNTKLAYRMTGPSRVVGGSKFFSAEEERLEVVILSPMDDEIVHLVGTQSEVLRLSGRAVIKALNAVADY